MAQNKQGKMANLINYRMRVTLNDGRQMTGSMLAFDKHMNLVLADTEEFRRVKSKPSKGATQAAPGSAGPALVETEQKRTLGLTIGRVRQEDRELRPRLWRLGRASVDPLAEAYQAD
ncbi:MAG: hypothetical protein M1838_003040 [Thelocarpon superellum]|nr:MAG: hypothetical protein M1838_003040 [Thelocarpon superellum]